MNHTSYRFFDFSLAVSRLKAFPIHVPVQRENRNLFRETAISQKRVSNIFGRTAAEAKKSASNRGNGKIVVEEVSTFFLVVAISEREETTAVQ